MYEARFMSSRHVNSQFNTYCCYENLSAFGEVSLCDLQSQNLVQNSCTQNNNAHIFQRIKFQLIFLISSHTIIQDINRQENVKKSTFFTRTTGKFFICWSKHLFFCGGAVEISVHLSHGTISLAYWFLTVWCDVVVSSSRVWMCIFILDILILVDGTTKLSWCKEPFPINVAPHLRRTETKEC